MSDAANRLHRLSIRYAGAIAEVAEGRKLALIPAGYPGIAEVRDLVDLVLLQRAEVNAITAIIIDKLKITPAALRRAFDNEYQWLCDAKAKQLGLIVTDSGLTLNREHVGDNLDPLPPPDSQLTFIPMGEHVTRVVLKGDDVTARCLAYNLPASKVWLRDQTEPDLIREHRGELLVELRSGHAQAGGDAAGPNSAKL